MYLERAVPGPAVAVVSHTDRHVAVRRGGVTLGIRTLASRRICADALDLKANRDYAHNDDQRNVRRYIVVDSRLTRPVAACPAYIVVRLLRRGWCETP